MIFWVSGEREASDAGCRLVLLYREGIVLNCVFRKANIKRNLR